MQTGRNNAPGLHVRLRHQLHVKYAVDGGRIAYWVRWPSWAACVSHSRWEYVTHVSVILKKRLNDNLPTEFPFYHIDYLLFVLFKKKTGFWLINSCSYFCITLFLFRFARQFIFCLFRLVLYRCTCCIECTVWAGICHWCYTSDSMMLGCGGSCWPSLPQGMSQVRRTRFKLYVTSSVTVISNK